MRSKYFKLQSAVRAVVLLALCMTGSPSPAAEGPTPPREHATREIYVPFSDLHVLLEHQPKRVLLSREEYDDLVKKAKTAPETHAPRPARSSPPDMRYGGATSGPEIKARFCPSKCSKTACTTCRSTSAASGLQNAKLDNRNATIGRGDGPHATGSCSSSKASGGTSWCLTWLPRWRQRPPAKCSTSACRVPLPPAAA